MRREPLPRFSSRRIDVGAIALNVVVEGAGPDVLLIHGFPDSHQVWRHQIPALVAAGHRVIAPDLRGFGDSDLAGSVSEYKLPKLVADMIAVLDALGVKQARVIAHDWGAVIGWQLAMRHPERVERYVALSVGHPTAYARGGLIQKLKAWYILFFQLRGLAEWLLKLGDWWLFGFVGGRHGESAQWRTDLSRPGRLTAALNLYRANLGLILPREYPHVAMPVLGVWSDGDVALAEKQMLRSREYADGGWRYERLEGASHWLQLDAPERVNSLLLDYLRPGGAAPAPAGVQR